MNFKQSYTFDDILILPNYSDVDSRADVDTSTTIAGIKLKIPLIAANMDTICGYEMAVAMGKLGGMGILHRFAPIEEQIFWVEQLRAQSLPAVPSVGVGGNSLEDALMLSDAGADAICIDVAHGNTAKVSNLIKAIRYHSSIHLIAGNFAGCPSEKVLEAGKFVPKIGIGPGSACETRLVAGVGMPQASAIYETNLNYGDTFIADGGIRKPADFAKAIALGADAVMVGGYFAGTDEVPEIGKTMFRGMASRSAQLEHRGRVSNGVAEGAGFQVKPQGPVAAKIEQLVGGLRSAMSYVGAHNLAEFCTSARFTLVSSASIKENGAHFKDL